MTLTRCFWLLAALMWAVPARSFAAPASKPASSDGVPSDAEMAQIRQEVETLRGKKFLRDVPARTITEAELRALVDREVTKEYPGGKLDDLEELMAWLDIVPPNTDLKSVFSDLMVDEVAGLYDTDTKTMRIPSFQAPNRAAVKNPKAAPRKKVDALPGQDASIIFAHEYTHALEDQYWPIDDPRDKERETSTDRGDARSFLYEGSATRLMIEALPAEFDRRRPGAYPWLWSLLHSGVGETALDFALGRIWKSADALDAGAPEALARGEVMPYCFGYSFCRRIQRDWGLDGLDYIYDHPPVSTAQVMHPEKCWEWRDFPVQVALPETLPGGWKRRMDDTIGEAGIAVLLGCQLKRLNQGQRAARGWDGDRAAIYAAADGHKLLAWASSWDSASAADRFAGAFFATQKTIHQASVTRKAPGTVAWRRSDGRAGLLWRDGSRVVIFVTDAPELPGQMDAWTARIAFTEPPEDALRAADNSPLLRFNPLLSWRKDGDYTVTRSLGGILWRHDHNSVGTADRALWGILGEQRRTSSLHQWELGWGLAARRQSEARRHFEKTTLLPFGVLYSHFSAALPQCPTNTLSRTRVAWGVVGSDTTIEGGGRTLSLLPWGLLLRRTSGPEKQSFHVAGTGLSHRTSLDAGATTRFHVLGFPVWSSRVEPAPTVVCNE